MTRPLWFPSELLGIISCLQLRRSTWILGRLDHLYAIGPGCPTISTTKVCSTSDGKERQHNIVIIRRYFRNLSERVGQCRVRTELSEDVVFAKESMADAKKQT